MPNEKVMDPLSPVRSIEPDSVSSIKHGTALCLSGGGYRAMLFHLGALWRLNDFGYLKKLGQASDSIPQASQRTSLGKLLIPSGIWQEKL